MAPTEAAKLPEFTQSSQGFLWAHQSTWMHSLQPLNPTLDPLFPHLKWLPYALQNAHSNYPFRWAHREDEGEWWLCQVQGYLTQGRWWRKLRINYGQNAGRWMKLPNLCVPLRGTLDVLWSWQPSWNRTFPFTSEDWRSIGKHLWYPRQVNT